jgi:hypothetical protein
VRASDLGPAVLVVLAAGCTSALHEPPPVTELGMEDATPATGADAASLVTAADAALEMSFDADSVQRARQLYLQAASTDDPPVEAYLGAARATAWLVEHGDDPARRREMATQGVQIGQLCRERFPGEPECRYRLALAVGQQARERPSTAADGLDVMVRLLRELTLEAPELDAAGPDRVLALVLLRAPGWPSGPGDPEVGLEHARAAAERFPDHPPNQLVLGEALLENGFSADGRRALRLGLDLAERRAAAGDPLASGWLAEAREAVRESHRTP